MLPFVLKNNYAERVMSVKLKDILLECYEISNRATSLACVEEKATSGHFLADFLPVCQLNVSLHGALGHGTPC